MKTPIASKQNYQLATAIAIAAGSLIVSSSAHAIDANDPLCRRVARPSQGLAIRNNPSTSATQVGGVGINERVLITTNPATARKDASGRTWIQVSQPAAGWVSNGFNPTNLAVCASNPNPNPNPNPHPNPNPNPTPGSRCRRVINPSEGLVIRKEATTSSAIVGGVGLYQRMTLTSSPATTSKDSSGRTWVQIEAPASGWVSNGTGGQSNIGVCP